MKQYKNKAASLKLYLELSEKTDEAVLFGEMRKKYTCWKLLLKAGFTGLEYNDFSNYSLNRRFPEYWAALHEYFSKKRKGEIAHEIIYVAQSDRKKVLLRAAEICEKGY